jgi:hypothetical protein
MNAEYFQDMSDCWASEVQPATYYRETAARARRLQANATTPRVRQYLDKMIAHCEQLAGIVEPRVLPSQSATNRRSQGSMIRRRPSKLMSRTF